MPNQNTLPSTTTQVSLGLYQACMKNKTTSVALNTAIPSAATALRGPRSRNEICTVRNVQKISSPKMV